MADYKGTPYLPTDPTDLKLAGRLAEHALALDNAPKWQNDTQKAQLVNELTRVGFRGLTEARYTANTLGGTVVLPETLPELTPVWDPITGKLEITFPLQVTQEHAALLPHQPQFKLAISQAQVPYPADPNAPYARYLHTLHSKFSQHAAVKTTLGLTDTDTQYLSQVYEHLNRELRLQANAGAPNTTQSFFGNYKLGNKVQILQTYLLEVARTICAKDKEFDTLSLNEQARRMQSKLAIITKAYHHSFNGKQPILISAYNTRKLIGQELLDVVATNVPLSSISSLDRSGENLRENEGASNIRVNFRQSRTRFYRSSSDPQAEPSKPPKTFTVFRGGSPVFLNDAPDPKRETEMMTNECRMRARLHLVTAIQAAKQSGTPINEQALKNILERNNTIHSHFATLLTPIGPFGNRYPLGVEDETKQLENMRRIWRINNGSGQITFSLTQADYAYIAAVTQTDPYLFPELSNDTPPEMTLNISAFNQPTNSFRRTAKIFEGLNDTATENKANFKTYVQRMRDQLLPEEKLVSSASEIEESSELIDGGSESKYATVTNVEMVDPGDSLSSIAMADVSVMPTVNASYANDPADTLKLQIRNILSDYLDTRYPINYWTNINLNRAIPARNKFFKLCQALEEMYSSLSEADRVLLFRLTLLGKCIDLQTKSVNARDDRIDENGLLSAVKDYLLITQCDGTHAGDKWDVTISCKSGKDRTAKELAMLRAIAAWDCLYGLDKVGLLTNPKKYEQFKLFIWEQTAIGLNRDPSIEVLRQNGNEGFQLRKSMVPDHVRHHQDDLSPDPRKISTKANTMIGATFKKSIKAINYASTKKFLLARHTVLPESLRESAEVKERANQIQQAIDKPAENAPPQAHNGWAEIPLEQKKSWTLHVAAMEKLFSNEHTHRPSKKNTFKLNPNHNGYSINSLHVRNHKSRLQIYTTNTKANSVRSHLERVVQNMPNQTTFRLFGFKKAADALVFAEILIKQQKAIIMDPQTSKLLSQAGYNSSEIARMSRTWANSAANAHNIPMKDRIAFIKTKKGKRSRKHSVAFSEGKHMLPQHKNPKRKSSIKPKHPALGSSENMTGRSSSRKESSSNNNPPLG